MNGYQAPIQTFNVSTVIRITDKSMSVAVLAVHRELNGSP